MYHRKSTSKAKSGIIHEYIRSLLSFFGLERPTKFAVVFSATSHRIIVIWILLLAQTVQAGIVTQVTKAIKVVGFILPPLVITARLKQNQRRSKDGSVEVK